MMAVFVLKLDEVKEDWCCTKGESGWGMKRSGATEDLRGCPGAWGLVS